MNNNNNSNVEKRGSDIFISLKIGLLIGPRVEHFRVGCTSGSDFSYESLRLRNIL